MIKDDLIAGHIPCGECDDFTHVIRASVAASLPDGYTGELCPKCHMWMCRLDKIGQKAEAGRGQSSMALRSNAGVSGAAHKD